MEKLTDEAANTAAATTLTATITTYRYILQPQAEDTRFPEALHHHHSPRLETDRTSLDLDCGQGSLSWTSHNPSSGIVEAIYKIKYTLIHQN